MHVCTVTCIYAAHANTHTCICNTHTCSHIHTCSKHTKGHTHVTCTCTHSQHTLMCVAHSHMYTCTLTTHTCSIHANTLTYMHMQHACQRTLTHSHTHTHTLNHAHSWKYHGSATSVLERRREAAVFSGKWAGLGDRGDFKGPLCVSGLESTPPSLPAPGRAGPHSFSGPSGFTFYDSINTESGFKMLNGVHKG